MNRFKINKRILIVLFFLLITVISKGQKTDTIVRRKYLDSVKNQLALHVTGYYTYLNLFERAENDRKKIYITLQATQNKLANTEEAWKRQNTLHGIFFVVVGLTSMLMIYILKIK
jgi:hypothetical protein